MMASLLLFGCAKSDVLGPESGSEQIGFETYIGRDAETKAASYGRDALPATIGVYGFYFGADAWSTTATPNLWTNLQLEADKNWAVPEGYEKYWVNSQDNYTFLSYAPYTPYATDAAENVLVASTGANPFVTYTVPTDLTKQIDLLYSNNNQVAHKPATGTAVTLQHKHALSRLTVKASAEVDPYAYTFHVKEISITGNFNTKGDLNLYNGAWSNLTDEDVTYTFFTTEEAATADNALGSTAVDYSGTKTVDGVTTYGNNYLMMIPVSNAKANPVLKVRYSTLYGGFEYNGREYPGLESEKTATLNITTDFNMGKAYAINIHFGHDSDKEIEFNVTEEEGLIDWNNNTIPIQ